ncbi:MAG TPA: hypothetical protein VFV39_04560 [Limnobacter sp.]|nr:hypothetical protein [Limnobacter sp.]
MSHPAPLWVFVPNMLVPQAALQRLGPSQRAQTFTGLPSGLVQTLARGAQASYVSAAGLDRVEAWLLRHLDCHGSAKFDQYPAWAMMNASEDMVPFTRFFGSVGSLEIERDGVRFWPAEALDVSTAELDAFWACASPLLASEGWSLGGDGGQPRQAKGPHVLLTGSAPVPMEQASPWSVQAVRLTDYLPMNDDCANWRRMWLNMQVELHNAPFNMAREQQGKKPLNALWFWGAGHAWQTAVPLPKLKTVHAQGVGEVDDTGLAGEGDGEVPTRFAFWQRCQGGLLNTSAAQPEPGHKPSTVYVVEFAGWGGNMAALDVLEREVLHPMRMAGLAHAWSLLGQDGWMNLSSSWLNRFKFWKNTPDWNLLAEPEPPGAPSEAELQAAWAQGQAEQDRIAAEWHMGGDKR